MFRIPIICLTAVLSVSPVFAGPAEDQVQSALIYMGFETYDNFGNDRSRAFALREFIIDVDILCRFKKSRIDILNSSVVDDPAGGYPMKAFGVQMVHDCTLSELMAPKVKADLESGNTRRITVAQNFLALYGFAVEPSGVLDDKTYEAATTFISAPMQVSQGFYYEGELVLGALMTAARHGWLPAPDVADYPLYLTGEQIEVAMGYGTTFASGEIWTREQAALSYMLEGGADGTYAIFLQTLSDNLLPLER